MKTFHAGLRTFICFHHGGFYFRVCGTGLSFEIDRPMLFSERIGYRKVTRLWRFSVEVLRKW